MKTLQLGEGQIAQCLTCAAKTHVACFRPATTLRNYPVSPQFSLAVPVGITDEGGEKRR